MSKATQIAFQLDNESLRQIDELATAKSWSRAQVLRVAVDELLATRREATIDAQLAAGYGAQPPGAEEDAWAEMTVDALRTADLAW
ncbi:MAG: hypothetical protein MSC31_09325 [Solirubrobacteraceae bacterium MAG38_C4-C5]|nr:hypothetical protein [Candidatus Siliceabacter maunaloa]